MRDQIGPVLVAVMLLIGPAVRALVYLVASAVSVWARTPRRRAAALRLVREIQGRDDDSR